MRRSARGAASAAPTLNALADQIREEITAAEEGHRSALAHAIRAGELLTEAKVQLAHGEWLPWLEENFDLTRQMATNYMRLAANGKRIFHLGSVNEALLAIRHERKPGTTPKTGKRKRPTTDHQPTITGKPALSHDPDVIEWVRERIRDGWDRDRLVDVSRSGEDGWPRPGKSLTNGGVSEVRAAIAALENYEPAEPKRAEPKLQPRGGKRKRKLYEEIRENGDTKLRRLMLDIAEATRKLEHMVLPDDVSLGDEAQDDIAMLYEDLMILAEWTETAVTATIAQMGDLTIQRKIKKLRDLAQDKNAPLPERKAAGVAADRLQRKNARALRA